MAYKEGTFGYYWTVKRGEKDIRDKQYNSYINAYKENLTSLYGCPKKVLKYLFVFKNNLTSLKYIPEFIGGDFDCRMNPELKSIDDIIDIFTCDIQGELYCDLMNKDEYEKGRELYLKLKDLDKVRKILKLKDKMR